MNLRDNPSSPLIDIGQGASRRTSADGISFHAAEPVQATGFDDYDGPAPTDQDISLFGSEYVTKLKGELRDADNRAIICLVIAALAVLAMIGMAVALYFNGRIILF